MPRRVLLALLCLAAAPAAGCGSQPVAEYPPPPRAPEAPPAAQDVVGRTVGRAAPAPEPAPVRLDRRRSTVTVGGRSARTPLDPTGAAVLGDRLFVVGGRERVLAAYALPALRELARVPAGAGPTQVVAHDGLVFVADTTGRTLLVFRTAPELALVHRTALPGAPWALAVDERRDRVWVTVPGRNRLLAFAATPRPDRVQGFGTVRQPDAVDVRDDGIVSVTGADTTQLIDPDGD